MKQLPAKAVKQISASGARAGLALGAKAGGQVTAGKAAKTA